MKKIAITTGDPAGIGSEIATKELQFHLLQNDCIYIVYGKLDKNIQGNVIQKIQDAELATETGKLYWIEIDAAVPFGISSKRTGEIAYQILDRCAEDIEKHKIDAVVTCPISKHAIQLSHPNFIGHTEFFADRFNTPDVSMSFWGKFFHVVLMTTHQSVKDVTFRLDFSFFKKKISLIVNQIKLLIPEAKFAVLAINPHAGENGAFGKEDRILGEVISHFQEEGILIDGPFPSDTFFSCKVKQYDVVISAFHDQGLIPFKMLSSDHGVNVTLGLPFLRTSVDHGTAFDIAGKNIADETSFRYALLFAEKNSYPFKSNSLYNTFAGYYDTYMKHVNYDGWVQFILQKYKEIKENEPEKIMELACGTGNITKRLCQKNFSMYGMDNSPAMLKIAAKKCPDAQFYAGNFLLPIPYSDFDLTILLFDSINYLKTEEEVVKLLNNVYISLKNDGIFIFDISTFANCEDNFDGFINLEESSNHFMIHESHFNYKLRTLKTKLSFFKKKGFLFEEFHENHEQKIYFCWEFLKMIKRTKFKITGIFTRDTERNLYHYFPDQIDHTYQRLYFVLQK